MSAVLLLGLRILSALALYSFLGWALYQLWRTLQQQTAFISARKITPLTLTIQTGDDASRSLQFEIGDLCIGRDPDCECRLEDSAISARHARLTYHHNQWWLEDLQSTNGTRLNNDTLLTPTVVVNSDLIQCGQTVLTVNIETTGDSHD